MIKECFVKELQGHRWCFRRHTYDDKFDMIDTFGAVPTIEMTEEQKAEVPNLKVLSVGFLLAKGIEAISNKTPISDVYNLFHQDQ